MNTGSAMGKRVRIIRLARTTVGSALGTGPTASTALGRGLLLLHYHRQDATHRLVRSFLVVVVRSGRWSDEWRRRGEHRERSTARRPLSPQSRHRASVHVAAPHAGNWGRKLGTAPFSSLPLPGHLLSYDCLRQKRMGNRHPRPARGVPLPRRGRRVHSGRA